MNTVKEITQEVWKFYGPNGIHPQYFDFELTIEQVGDKIILVEDYFVNHDIEFKHSSYVRTVILDVLIQIHVYNGLPPANIEYMLGLDPYAEFINEIVEWAD